MYYSERTNSDTIDNALKEINQLISETNLPELGIGEDTYSDDFEYDFNKDYAKSEYYERAQKEIDNGFVFGEGALFPINDIDDLAENLWLEHVSEVNSNIIEEINDKIEDWLRAIDKEYGTHYEPTGGQRR